MSDDPALVRAMASRIAHRGPDDADTWVHAPSGVALGFRRLAILDLSPAGRQPMVSPSGRYVMVFNGEIYNHAELRSELHPGRRGWRGRSDTETLLAGIDQWGLETVLARAVGMFAFAVWDREAHELVLARDRMGEKPLYYGWQGSVFLFGSELKALRPHPSFSGEIDLDVLALYLRFGYVPAPHCIYRGLHKLMPGTILRVPAATCTSGPEEAVAYWDLASVAATGAAHPFGGSDGEAVDQLDRLLSDAISLQRVADVPVGAFLSGGVDSSTIVALLQRQSTSPVKTFTIGFDERAFDESPHGAAVARHLGTDHVELRVTAHDAMEVVPRLPELYDEPFADASAIPTFLVSQLARQHVTVSLSGDGGDELFGGYTRYARTLQLQAAVHRLPAGLGRGVAAALGWVPGQGIQEALVTFKIGSHPQFFTQRLDTVRTALASGSVEAIYRSQQSLWRDPASVLRYRPEPRNTVHSAAGLGLAGAPALDQMLYADAMCYLPDDILVKVDRAAMAVSLESRIPLLDHRVVEFAWSLPSEMKLRGGTTKWLLRRLLARYVPDTLVERPKQGFAVPVGDWLSGGLRAWAEDALQETRLRDDGLLRPEVVRLLWAQHVSGRHDWQYRLWPIIVFQQWLRHVAG